MDQYIQGVITILSLVNPVICGLLFSQAVSAKPRAAQIASATQATLAIMVILWLAAVGGAYLLKAFGISLDAFQAAGGMVLGWMGFHMLSGAASPTTGHSGSQSLTPLILFAASPGTITGVITLSVAHSGSQLPVTVLVAVAVALAITWLVMVLSSRSTGDKKQGLMHDVLTRFMGLIVLAMGVQFLLSGLKAFFAV